MIPKVWHLYSVDLEPGIGTKPGKQRPCLVIQPTEFSEAGLQSTVVIPVTSKVTQVNAFPLRVHVPKGMGGLMQSSDLLIDQLLAWDNRFFRKEIGRLPEALVIKTKEALRNFLDL